MSDEIVPVNHAGIAVKIDHLLLAVENLDHAAAVVADRYGLTSIEGGSHTDWGTVNRIIPVGDAYIKLIALFDPAKARRNDFGRWLRAHAQGVVEPLGWGVRTGSLDDVAMRLDLPVESGSRAAPQGRMLRWRLAGVAGAAANPSLPFFMEWGSSTPHPSRLPVIHPAGRVEIGRVELIGDSDSLATWLGDHDLPVVKGPGPSAVRLIVLTLPTGELILERMAGR